ncbi:uncharacterized protein RSE6_11511 [Rhynchosporium secalis]|uniref:Uncharacterized protein n=1 Tax=Rhynchosporium secalis TaxID=38038 RepID=A0A1E1MN64_RHYSE|nr:uncharacterized protein RSE6_11511 [Rhynchosporium secalis]
MGENSNQGGTKFIYPSPYPSTWMKQATPGGSLLDRLIPTIHYLHRYLGSITGTPLISCISSHHIASWLSFKIRAEISQAPHLISFTFTVPTRPDDENDQMTREEAASSFILVFVSFVQLPIPSHLSSPFSPTPTPGDHLVPVQSSPVQSGPPAPPPGWS